jgi:hypothetical protein
MYQFSRAIYRDLAPYILEDAPSRNGTSNHVTVLQACESAMDRLAADRRHFARPARALFRDIRAYFSVGSQLHVYTVIHRNIELAERFLDRFPEYELGFNGAERECQAMTRKGQPCQRRPLPRSDYCPSHQHLTEDFDELTPAFDDLEEVGLAA